MYTALTKLNSSVCFLSHRIAIVHSITIPSIIQNHHYLLLCLQNLHALPFRHQNVPARSQHPRELQHQQLVRRKKHGWLIQEHIQLLPYAHLPCAFQHTKFIMIFVHPRHILASPSAPAWTTLRTNARRHRPRTGPVTALCTSRKHKYNWKHGSFGLMVWGPVLYVKCLS